MPEKKGHWSDYVTTEVLNIGTPLSKQYRPSSNCSLKQSDQDLHCLQPICILKMQNCSGAPIFRTYIIHFQVNLVTVI